MKGKRGQRWLVLVSLLAAMLLAACGESGSTLDGSIKTLLDIDFETVEVQFFGDALRVQYQRAFQATTEKDVVAEITVSTVSTALTTQTAIPFVGNATLERFMHKVSASGVLIEDTEQGFPPVFDGSIEFFQLSTNVGETISGTFSVTFNSGLVMSGDFVAPLGAAGDSAG
jgi:hypothetical protein